MIFLTFPFESLKHATFYDVGTMFIVILETSCHVFDLDGDQTLYIYLKFLVPNIQEERKMKLD